MTNNMQNVYATVFNIVYKLTSHINERTRNGCLFICSMLLFCLYFFDLKYYEGIGIEAKGLIIVLLMLLFSINSEMKTFRWNRLTYYPMVMFGIGILIIGQLHYVGDTYVMYALDLILIFPALYYVWNSRGDHETLYNIISAALLVCGIISFCFCLVLAFRGELVVSETRVSGHKEHPNYLGMMGVSVLLSGVYLFAEFKRNANILLSAAGIGIGLSYVIISASRTSMIAACVCILTLLIFNAKGRRLGIHASKKSAMLIVAAVLIIGAFVALGMSLNDINQAVLQKNNQDVELDEQMNMTNEAETVANRLQAGGKNADSFSSGRISIWKVYLQNTTMTGKPISEIQDELKGLAETRAHNNFLEYYYRFGYIVGTIYLVFFVAMGIAGLRILFGKDSCRPKDLYVVMIIGTYAVFSMLEIAMLPFIRIIPCIYFLTIAPILCSNTSY